MSIAVSALVQPSRLLFAMTGMMSVGAALIGIAIAAGRVGDLSFAIRLWGSLLAVFLSFFGFYHGTCYRKPIHIDISGTGQLRLTEVAVTAPCADTNWPHVREIGEVVRLMNDSTIWPYLLLLRLQSASGKIRVLPILQDCVSQDSFRALSVACRWIAVQNERSEREA
jgi:toxin CptA